MKKSYKLENIDCANCAAKMENNINKMEGVSATISFMMQRLTIEAADDKFEEVLEEASRIIKKIEPDCVIRR